MKPVNRRKSGSNHDLKNRKFIVEKRVKLVREKNTPTLALIFPNHRGV